MSATAQLPEVRTQRVLACVLCQQRKVKCNRKFPCSNCLKNGAECVPAALIPRQRKRRFPERELLDRIRNYEGLLRQHKIKFEPLHGQSPHGSSQHESPENPQGDVSSSTPSTTSKPESVEPRGRNFWHAMNQNARNLEEGSDSSDDDVREGDVKEALNQSFRHTDHLCSHGLAFFFAGNDHLGPSKQGVDTSTLHPGPARILRLWQIYLENVDPLFKVTHQPTLQGRIIEATGNIENVPPVLEALMFAIYCMAIVSLAPDDCRVVFNSSREDLLTTYRFGCQQALMNSGFLQSRDRDCLTALFLYLVSIGRSTHPQAISSLFGIAIRVAQHMGIHKESSLSKCSPFEAEMRRRLWWSLVTFDNRMGELGGCMDVTLLSPTWDCRIPLNVNDPDLLPEMSELPAATRGFTEATFAVTRAELANFMRHAGYHLDFTFPALKHFARDSQTLSNLERTIEDAYLGFCDLKIPLHFMAVWMVKAYLARSRLVESYSESDPSDIHRENALSFAFSMLGCFTTIMASPLSRRYRWFVEFFFPFPAYIHITQFLKTRPLGRIAEKAWEVMSDNYEATFSSFFVTMDRAPVFRIFAATILQAWKACEAASGQDHTVVPPKIVSEIRERLAQLAQDEQAVPEQPGSTLDPDFFVMGSVSTHQNPFDMRLQDGYGGDEPVDLDMSHLDWSTQWV